MLLDLLRRACEYKHGMAKKKLCRAMREGDAVCLEADDWEEISLLVKLGKQKDATKAFTKRRSLDIESILNNSDGFVDLEEPLLFVGMISASFFAKIKAVVGEFVQLFSAEGKSKTLNLISLSLSLSLSLFCFFYLSSD